MIKPPIHRTLVRLKAILEQRQANVSLIYLPGGGGASKQGVDDYLVNGHTIDNLLAGATVMWAFLVESHYRRIRGDISSGAPFLSLTLSSVGGNRKEEA